MRLFLSVLSLALFSAPVANASPIQRFEPLERFKSRTLEKVRKALEAVRESPEAGELGGYHFVNSAASTLPGTSEEVHTSALEHFLFSWRNDEFGDEGGVDPDDVMVEAEPNKNNEFARALCIGAFDEKLAVEGPWTDETLEALVNYRQSMEVALRARGLMLFRGIDNGDVTSCGSCFLVDLPRREFLVVSSCAVTD